MFWPFKRRKKRKKKAQSSHPGSPRARERKDELKRRRMKQSHRTRRKKTQKGHPRTQARGRPGHGHAPHTEDVEPWHRAPPGPAVWGWVKRAPPDYWEAAWHEPNPWGIEDYRKWPRDPAPRKARAIRRHVLQMILEAGRSQWPQEFAGLLRAEDGVIEELVLLPGTIAGDTHAIFQFHMMPSDPDIIGTIHSHPNPIPYPSAADTELFRGHGRLHIIACYPFRENDWNAFNERSYKVELEVVD